MLGASTWTVPTPVGVWGTSLATDTPAGPEEFHNPGVSTTSTTNFPKGSNQYTLHFNSMRAFKAKQGEVDIADNLADIKKAK